jgi:hypothetical protein
MKNETRVYNNNYCSYYDGRTIVIIVLITVVHYMRVRVLHVRVYIYHMCTMYNTGITVENNNDFRIEIKNEEGKYTERKGYVLSFCECRCKTRNLHDVV